MKIQNAVATVGLFASMFRQFFERSRLAASTSVLVGAASLLMAMSGEVYAQSTFAIINARIETLADEEPIERGTLLVRDGKIVAVGKEVEVPIDAAVMDGKGQTIMPGIVDPYYVVSIGRNTQSAPTRTVVFRGRTFVVGGGAPAIATTFAKLADGVDLKSVNWESALRCGITTLNLTTGGFAQSALGEFDAKAADGPLVMIQNPDGQLLVTVSNETKSLSVLKTGLSKEESRSARPTGRPSPEQIAAMRARSASRGRPSSTSSSSTSKGTATKEKTAVEKLWDGVKEGKSPLFINADSASTLLHVERVAKEQEKAGVVLVASGPDVYLNLRNLDSKRHHVVLPPRIDLKPDSRKRINVPAMLDSEDIDFSFSLSLGQSDFRAMQHNPLFAVGMLVRGGLDRGRALQALTIAPAKLLGIEKEVGSLEEGKVANFIVYDGDPLAATSEIVQVYSRGERIHGN
ncbi:MAG: amidohydrolase family protein [Pirellulaceae bacterium]